MKSTKYIALAIAIAVICAGLAVGVTAQRGPMGPGRGDNGPGQAPPPPPRPVIKAGTNGVFVLLGGTLTKLNAADLSEAGSLQLLEKPADEGNDTDDMPQLPPLCGTMIVTSGSPELVVVVIADKVFTIDAAQWAVTAEATLPKPEPPAEDGNATMAARGNRGPNGQGQQGGQNQQRPMGPPQRTVELHGSTLYVVDGPQIAAVDIKTGTVLAQTTLPKPDNQDTRQ